MKTSQKAAWTSENSYEDSINILLDLAWSHALEAGRFSTPLADCLRNRDWLRLCNFELDYLPSDSDVHLYNARQTLAFFQKLEPLQLGVDKELVAYKKFQSTELACKETNHILRLTRSGGFTFPSFVNSVLYTAQRKISRVLGRVPTLTELRFGFGPGATTTTKKKYANWATKLNSRLECSSNTAQLLPALAAQLPHWFFLHAHACSVESAFTDVQIGVGRLQFVPKNAKTYRSILVEPVLNSFVQHGIGKHLRHRLKRFGVDLDDQSRNQTLAQSGSIDDSLATIDLSSASDTISRELVYELLPLDWACFLEAFRTPRAQYKGQTIALEKFSSMGNGFTFELETLIFWALSEAVLDLRGFPTRDLAVYGDDIVLDARAVPDLLAVFRSVGFSVNMEKSFWAGPFRESCGKDYFKGTDIRPYYQKTVVSNMTLFSLHNFYMRTLDFGRAQVVRSLIHPSLHIFGPDGYGDGHLIGSWVPSRHEKQLAAQGLGWEGSFFDTFQLMPRRLKRVPDTDWNLPTYCIYVQQGSDTRYDANIVPGSDGYRRMMVYTLRRGVFL